MKKFIISFISIILLFFLSLKFYFWEPYDFTKNSLAYYLKVDDDIKHFPIFSPKEEPKYKVYIADGLTPSGVQVDYETELNLPILLMELKKYSFKCTKDASGPYFCEKRDKDKSLISIAIMDTIPLKMTVTFILF
jgi:hypothetical protein